MFTSRQCISVAVVFFSSLTFKGTGLNKNVSCRTTGPAFLQQVKEILKIGSELVGITQRHSPKFYRFYRRRHTAHMTHTPVHSLWCLLCHCQFPSVFDVVFAVFLVHKWLRRLQFIRIRQKPANFGGNISCFRTLAVIFVSDFFFF